MAKRSRSFREAVPPPSSRKVNSSSSPYSLRARPVRSRRGFTLVEVTVVSLIVGILATLSFRVVARQVSLAKSSEARGVLGGIKKAAIVAYGDEMRICNTAEPVPSSIALVQASKYQSRALEWHQGSAHEGWACLRFRLNGPQYYQYGYDRGGAQAKVTLPSGALPPGLARDDSLSAWARGDLDGDSRLSWLAINGQASGGELQFAPRIQLIDEGE